MIGTALIALIGYGFAIALAASGAIGLFHAAQMRRSKTSDTDDSVIITLVLVIFLFIFAFGFAGATREMLHGAI